MIEFKNVHLNIKNVDVSNDISFKIMDNTVTCFLGSKNSGKSSILKMIAGIYKSYTGEILIDDKNIRDFKEKKIGIINEQEEKDTYITVVEYLNFYGSLYDTIEKDQLSEFIDEMLNRFSLMSYKYTYMHQLEKENYKFVEMIRLLIYDPDIFLLDNLFFGDNVEYHEKMFTFIKTLIGKKTIIFASRNTNYIESICDNIGILDNGILIAFDKKEDIYKYADIVDKIEIKVLGDIDRVVSKLKENDKILNISYDDSSIVIAMKSKDRYMDHKEIEYGILKYLIDNNIKVYSFRKQQVRYEQLFEGIS